MWLIRASGSALVAAVACSPALADLDWGTIDTAASPDFVRAFDLADPGGTITPLGRADGNFNRGMDFYSRNAFYYYVSTDSLNDPGDRGLWRWDNNVNTQLFNTPFNDSTDGDATLSNDGSRFYVATIDGDATAGHSLYAFDNLNGAVTFTEIGETGLSALFGIAMDPVSGNIYAYSGTTETLYTLDATTGAPTVVGASGQAFGAIGGMDFSADGSTLLLSNGGALWRVDKDTGLMVAAGDTTFNDSALSFRVPEPSSLGLLGFAGLSAWRRRRITG